MRELVEAEKSATALVKALHSDLATEKATHDQQVGEATATSQHSTAPQPLSAWLLPQEDKHQVHARRHTIPNSSWHDPLCQMGPQFDCVYVFRALLSLDHRGSRLHVFDCRSKRSVEQWPR